MPAKDTQPQPDPQTAAPDAEKLAGSDYTRKEPTIRTLLACFYSFKGGVGRSQALTAVGHLLAQRRRRVLLVDMDLEAPGISVALLSPEAREGQDGFLEVCRDLSRQILNAAREGHPLADDLIRITAEQIAKCLHALPLPAEAQEPELLARIREDFPQLPIPEQEGGVFLLSCGRIYRDYVGSVAELSLPELLALTWEDVDAGRREPLLKAAGMDPAEPPENLLQILVKILHDAFVHDCVLPGDAPPDYVLVDSRAGLADIGGICVRGLADHLVILSGLNRQNLEGTRRVLDRYRQGDRSPALFTTVLSPVPDAELELLEARLKEAKDALALEDDPLLLHYQPRVALLEEPFIQPHHRNSQLARDYLRLCSRLQQAKRDDWFGLADRGIRELLGSPQTEAQRKAMENLIEAAGMAEDQTMALISSVGNQLLGLSRFPTQGLGLLRMLAAWKPDDVAAWGTLAQQLCQAGLEELGRGELSQGRVSMEEGFTRYGRALDLEDDPARTLHSWGTALAQYAERLWESGEQESAAAQYQEAFARFARALEVKPDFHEALNNWGNGLGEYAQRLWDSGEQESAAGRYEEAFARYARALEVKPDKHDALYNWGTALGRYAERLWDSGKVEEAAGRYEEAFARCARALEIKAEMHQALNNWGNALGRYAQRLWDSGQQESAAGRYEEAFARYARALEVKPDKHEALYNWGGDLINLARRLRDAGEDAKAAEYFEAASAKLNEAERLHPGGGAYNLACLMAVTGHPDHALSWLTRAIESTPSDAADAEKEPDFDSIRDDPRFQELIRPRK